MLMPIFPKLSSDLTPRVEKALDRAKARQVSESALVEFFNKMMGAIYGRIAQSPRVKGDFERLLPPLIGRKLQFQVEGLTPWIIEVVPLPQVLSISLGGDDKLPGFAGDFDVAKTVLTSSVVTVLFISAVREKRFRLLNASKSEPVVWIRDLFALLGPTLDRKDLREKAVAEAAPMLRMELDKLGC